MIINEIEICKNCKSKNSISTDYYYGELVCKECGLVYEEGIIVDEYEKRTSADDTGDNQIHRVGPAQNPAFGNECGINLIIKERGKTKVIKDHTNISKIHGNFMRIERLLSEHNIDDALIRETKSVYDEISKNHTTMKGKNLNHIFIGAYFCAYRQLKMAKTFKEITQEFNLTERKVKRVYKCIKNDVKIEENNNGIYDRCKNYIKTFLEENNNKNNDVQMLSFKIIENTIENELLEGKSPLTISGLALVIAYALSNDNSYDKEKLFDFFSKEEVIKKSYREIKDNLNLMVPQEYKGIISSIFIPL